MKTRLICLGLAMLSIIAVGGCATKRLTVNADIAESGEELFDRLQSLKQDMPYAKVFTTLKIDEKRFSPMRSTEMMAVKTGTANPNLSNLREAEDFARTHPGVLLQFQNIGVNRLPRFSWSGLIGIRERQVGPDQWLFIIFKDCTQLTLKTCKLDDAKLSGPFNVNVDGTQWIWSLLPQIIESGAAQATKNGVNALVP